MPVGIALVSDSHSSKSPDKKEARRRKKVELEGQHLQIIFPVVRSSKVILILIISYFPEIDIIFTACPVQLESYYSCNQKVLESGF